MSNEQTTRHYCKTIAISEDNLNWIRENKENKSAAGKLNEIIEFYKLTQSNLKADKQYENLQTK